MINTITNNLNLVRPHLPTAKKAALGALTIAASAYLGGIPAALTAIATFGGYKLISERCCSQDKLRVKMVQEKFKTELFKRLPKALKEEILAEVVSGGVSNEEMSLLRGDPSKWNDMELIRKLAIRACLEGKMSEKELGYYMLHGMAQEMREKLPGVAFMSSQGQSKANLEAMTDLFCQTFDIPKKVLGKPSLREDAFFVVAMNDPLDANKPFHYTAQLSRDSYPFVITQNKTGQKRIFVFQPHIYEKLLAHTHPEYPEKPLFALGTRSIETLSDNSKRILAMTGGTTIPTPNIEANEALALPFYLHDCYHLDIDSAIGVDRIFWNGFGKHLLQCSKNASDDLLKEAFGTLAEFCLDKEFENYKQLPKNLAFLAPLVGMCSVAGKRQVDDQKEPFKLIKDDSFAKVIRNECLTQFKRFWHENAPGLPLRADLTKERLLAFVPTLKGMLQKQGESFPPELEKCLKSL